jgi:hypothetical protein
MPSVTKFPTADIVVSGTWSNPTNVQADDGSNATTTIAAKNTSSQRRQGTYNFDADLPANATIDSVDLEMQGNVSTTGGIAFLGYGIRVSTTDGAISEDNGEPTSPTIYTSTDIARPGGGSWSRADLLNGTLFTYVQGRSGNNATSVIYSFDYIKVTVNYSLPSTFDALGLAGD